MIKDETEKKRERKRERKQRKEKKVTCRRQTESQKNRTSR